MKRTLFITGAAGFIGHETCKEAVKAGWQVTALVHSEQERRNAPRDRGSACRR